VLEGEYLLTRTAEADEDQLGPGGPDLGDDAGVLLVVGRAEARRRRADDADAGKALAQVGLELLHHLRPAAIEKNRNTLLVGDLAEPQHQGRAIDAVAQAGAMQKVERPAHRLAVGHDHVEAVEAVALR